MKFATNLSYYDPRLKDSFWLTRIVYLQFLSFLYSIAFAVALHQNESLFGENGLTPADRFMKRYHHHFVNKWEGFIKLPTIFWFIPASTTNINSITALGLILSLFMLIRGSANIFLLFMLWASYFSIVSIGQTWYSFGWESQLLEMGFLAMFMVPIFSLSRFPRYTCTPLINIWGNRWLLFRIMIGAGMIKIRGDACWRDLTCMNYHYETQPVPNPLSIYFHHNLPIMHKIETFGNHIVELILPWLLLVPCRMPQLIGGVAQILFQVVLISSGNLAFLNWLTILPAIMSFDDYSWAFLFSKKDINMALQINFEYKRLAGVVEMHDTNIMTWTDHMRKYFTYTHSWPSGVIFFRRITTLLITALIAHLSYPVVNNLLSLNQAMNASFETFRIVNTYGAFGSITKIRHEVIIQGTYDDVNSKHKNEVVWKEFQFTCKPGDINRKPCLISPYHFRIDWLMWFAAFQNYQHASWIIHLADKILRGDLTVNQLLAANNGNPFYNSTATLEDAVKQAPKYVRAVLYDYKYPSLSIDGRREEELQGWEVGLWWRRKFVREYFPPIVKDNLSVRQFLVANNMQD